MKLPLNLGAPMGLLLMVGFIEMTASVFGNAQVITDQIVATALQADEALKQAAILLDKQNMTPKEVLILYRQEEIIGAFAKVLYMQLPDRDLPEMGEDSIGIRCAGYVKRHIDRFREVNDGWKGEFNYWEPGSHWLSYLETQGLAGVEARELEFDLAFKDFVRKFNFNDGARNKNCRQFYDELVRGMPEYAKSYSREEIDSMPPSCSAQRKKFIKGRRELLHRFKGVPSIEKLRKLDPTTVISDKYFGLC